MRESCVFSQLLFNIYSKLIFREAIERIKDSIKVNGKCLNSFRYVDDTVNFYKQHYWSTILDG